MMAGEATGVPWSTNYPKPYEIAMYEGDRYPATVWMIKADDIWTVHCMDCGIRLGTVNAGNERGAVQLHRDHERTSHR